MLSEAALAAWPDSQALSLLVKDGLVRGQEVASSTSRSSPVQVPGGTASCSSPEGADRASMTRDSVLCHWKGIGSVVSRVVLPGHQVVPIHAVRDQGVVLITSACFARR